MTSAPCSVSECGGRVVARGWCNRHYLRWRNHGDPLAGGGEQRVRKAVDLEDGTRVCVACSVRLPVDSFGADKSASGGRRTECKPCRSAKMKAWYQANRERQAQRQRDRITADPDRARRQDMERYERSKPKRLELAKEGMHRRRALMRDGEWERGVTTRSVRKRDGDLCHYCRSAMSFEPAPPRTFVPLLATLEHVLPLSRGGGHTMANAVLACWQCNVRKNNKTVEEWAR